MLTCSRGVVAAGLVVPDTIVSVGAKRARVISDSMKRRGKEKTSLRIFLGSWVLACRDRRCAFASLLSTEDTSLMLSLAMVVDGCGVAVAVPAVAVAAAAVVVADVVFLRLLLLLIRRRNR